MPRDLDQVDRAVAVLEHEWAEQKRGWSGFVKKWGAVLGLVAAAITLPKSIVEGYNVLFTSEQSSLTRGVPIVMEYDASRSLLRLTFSFALVNSGNASDMIQDAWATLTPPGNHAAERISFPRSVFRLTEHGRPMKVPFVLSKSSSYDVECIVEANVNADTIPTTPGDWVFRMDLVHPRKSRPLGATYVLFAPAGYIDDLKRPNSAPLIYENPKEAS